MSELAIEHIRDPRPGRSGHTLCGHPWAATSGPVWTCQECLRLRHALRPVFQCGSWPRMV